MATLVGSWKPRPVFFSATVISSTPAARLPPASRVLAVPVWDSRISGILSSPPRLIAPADVTEMRGHVYRREADSSLTPVPGAFVYAFLHEGMQKWGRARSGAGGEYVFPSVPKGVQFVLIVRDPSGAPIHNAVVVDRAVGAAPLTGP